MHPDRKADEVKSVRQQTLRQADTDNTTFMATSFPTRKTAMRAVCAVPDQAGSGQTTKQSTKAVPDAGEGLGKTEPKARAHG